MHVEPNYKIDNLEMIIDVNLVGNHELQLEETIFGWIQQPKLSMELEFTILPTNLWTFSQFSKSRTFEYVDQQFRNLCTRANIVI